MASCLWIYCGDCAAVLHQRPNTFWLMAMGISDLSDNAHSVPPLPLTLTPHTQMHYSPGEPRMLPPSSPSHCHQRGASDGAPADVACPSSHIADGWEEGFVALHMLPISVYSVAPSISSRRARTCRWSGVAPTEAPGARCTCGSEVLKY
jgi:hypothetical protein